MISVAVKVARTTPQPGPTRRVLIVANKTQSDDKLLELLADLMATQPCQFYILVPGEPGGVQHHGASIPPESRAAAAQRMFDLLRFLYEMDADAVGRVSRQPPMRAIADLLCEESFDEIVLSILPPDASGWIAEDLPQDVARSFALPVTPVVSTA